MKMHIDNRLGFAFLILVLIAAVSGCRQSHITVQINTDGTCAVTTESVFSRMVIKQQIKQMAAYIKMSGKKFEGLDPELLKEPENGEDETDSGSEPDAARERMKQQILALHGAFYAKKFNVSGVEITDHDVRIQSKKEYPGLSELFENPEFVDTLGYDGIRLETQGGSHAILTLYRDPNEPNKLSGFLKKMSSQNFTGSIKFILPGKIIESALDHAQDHATWSTFDSSDEKLAAQQMAALDESPAITFERGGLPLSAVLDSQQSSELAAAANKIGGGIPLTPQSDGYLAEAISVATTRIIAFGGRDAVAGKAEKSLSSASEGIQVSARLYAPRGRHFLAVHSLKVLQATDDGNRALAVPDKDLSKTDGNMAAFEQRNTSDQMDILIRLPLPGAALGAIEKMDLEAETVTCGGWKPHRIAGHALKDGGEYDISAVLEGGRLKITNLNAETAQTGQIHLEVTGAGNPYELEFKMEQGGKPLNIYTYDDAEKGKLSNSRTLQLNYYRHSFSQKQSEGQPDLIIRRPLDMKREMVRFELSEIDLY